MSIPAPTKENVTLHLPIIARAICIMAVLKEIQAGKNGVTSTLKFIGREGLCLSHRKNDPQVRRLADRVADLNSFGSQLSSLKLIGKVYSYTTSKESPNDVKWAVAKYKEYSPNSNPELLEFTVEITKEIPCICNIDVIGKTPEEALNNAESSLTTNEYRYWRTPGSTRYTAEEAKEIIKTGKVR